MILQLLKLIAARNPQIIEVWCAIELPQFAPRNVLNVRRQLTAALAIPDAFGFRIGEGADHLSSRTITRVGENYVSQFLSFGFA